MRYEAKTEPEAVEARRARRSETARPRSEYRVIRDEKSFWGGRVVEIEVEEPEGRRRSRVATRACEAEPEAASRRPWRPALRPTPPRRGGALPGATDAEAAGAGRVDADGAAFGGRPSRRDRAAAVLERRDALRALRRRRRAPARQQGRGPDRPRGPGRAASRPSAPAAPCTRGSTPKASAPTARRRSRSSPSQSADEVRRSRRPHAAAAARALGAPARAPGALRGPGGRDAERRRRVPETRGGSTQEAARRCRHAGRLRLPSSTRSWPSRRPLGRSALALVRLSGPGRARILRALAPRLPASGRAAPAVPRLASRRRRPADRPRRSRPSSPAPGLVHGRRRRGDLGARQPRRRRAAARGGAGRRRAAGAAGGVHRARVSRRARSTSCAPRPSAS